MSILVNVVNQKMFISSTMSDIVDGSQNFVKFKFNLSEEWDNLMTFAQFKQGDTAYNVYLDKDNSVFLPPEIGMGTCTLMLYGTHDTTIGTTNYLTLKINKNILVSNVESTDISQSLYDQLVTKVNELSSWNEQYGPHTYYATYGTTALVDTGEVKEFVYTLHRRSGDSEEVVSQFVISGGGISPLIVTIDAATGKATRTSGQIAQHLREGGTVIARSYQYDGSYLRIQDFYYSRCYETEQHDGSVNFYVSFVSTVESTLTILEIDDTGEITVDVTDLATADQIGDISSALDKLHNYAQGLINGGAAE